MTNHQINAALARLVGVSTLEDGSIKGKAGRGKLGWLVWDPLHNWDQLAMALDKAELVVISHTLNPIATVTLAGHNATAMGKTKQEALARALAEVG